MYANVAKSIRRHILQAHNEYAAIPWPPSAKFFQSDALAPPAILTNFIELVLTGKPGKTGDKATEKTDRIATSIAEDICANTTN